MFGTGKFCYILVIVLYTSIEICTGEVESPFLALYSPGEPDYTEVLIHRIGDNLTLVCELKGDPSPRVFVWNFVNDNGTDGGRTFSVDPSGLALASTLERTSLQVSDSGQYMCSAPPFSVTKYILVQPKGPSICARGALSCGKRCVLPTYVCDGRPDCSHSEDELPPLCGPLPCARVDRLNCSSGRCVPEAACCRRNDPLCLQPACCNEHPRYARLPGYLDVEYPPLYEDRHAPDDYGFIQSTIYTVTACALIFMVAVVLLVSALCKMHMKRAALRGYALAHRRARDHYAVCDAARYPPRYEAASLLESSPAPPAPPAQPALQPQDSGAAESPVRSPETDGPQTSPAGFGLARLSHIFSRYRQVPTQADVELTDVRPASVGGSPRRVPVQDYRSPACCDPDMYFTNPELSDCGRDLNYMATPVEFFRRRALRRNTLDRVMDQITQAPRPLTLQLGRFQLSIPRFGRRPEEPRPDTPNVAEINIDDLDFVRLNSNETYTLNGRTIHLLGANFENYPVLDNRPPPYNEAMRYKMYGPPPEYLSREGIDRSHSYSTTETEARNNIEMPPGYDELAAGHAPGPAPAPAGADTANNNVPCATDGRSRDAGRDGDGESNANNNNNTNTDATRNPNGRDAPALSGVLDNSIITSTNNNVIDCGVSPSNAHSVPESIHAVMATLPAIDSDVNANDTRYVLH